MNKIQPIEGDDGRLYYNYSVSTVFETSSDGKIIINDCFFIDETESYELTCYNVTDDGETVRKLSVMQLEYLVHKCGYQITENGVAKEIPLTKAEVKDYYAFIERISKSKKAIGEKELKKEDTYKELLNKRENLEEKIADAIAFNRADDFDELIKEYTAVRAQLLRIMQDKKVKASTLKLPDKCPKCYGLGVIGKAEKICDCAYDNAEEIKAWNAKERLKVRFRENWLNNGDVMNLLPGK